MDNLNYTYDGNQLTKVKDFGKKQYGFIDGADTDQEYVYDLNGNPTTVLILTDSLKSTTPTGNKKNASSIIFTTLKLLTFHPER